MNNLTSAKYTDTKGYDSIETKASVSNGIGNTALVKISEGLYAKLESSNPSGSIKDRMAKHLLDLAEERNNQEAINKDIRDIHKTLEASGELRSVLKSPVIDVNAKVNSLKAIFKSVSEDVKNLFSVLANNNRIAELNLVTKKYIELYDEKNNVKVALVTTAEALTPAIEAKLLAKVKSLTGSEVTIKNKIDESILGGFILRIGDQQYDASIQGKLNTLRTRFKNKAHV